MAFLGIIMIVLIFLIMYLVDKSHAKQFALQFMFIVEKKAEDYSITDGKQKLEWVVHQYDKLPSTIKVIISKQAFRILIQQLFDEAMKKVSKSEVNKINS